MDPFQVFYGPLVFLRLKNNFVESIFQEPSPSRGNWVLSRNFPLTLFRLVWKFRFKDSRSCVLFRKNNFVQTVYSFLSLSLCRLHAARRKCQSFHDETTSNDTCSLAIYLPWRLYDTKREKEEEEGGRCAH